MKKQYLLPIKKSSVFVLIFFIIYLVIGVSIYKDYGISWDEPSHREIAGVSAKYILSIFMPDFHPPQFDSLPHLAGYSARQYGVVFDLPMYIADLWLGYDNNRPEAYYMRHLFNFLLFYLSVFFFFLIVKNRFNSWVLGLTASFFLILSPRIFADSFYGKDVVFLSLFIISIYFFIRYLKEKSFINCILFALSSALMVDQRVTGIFVPFLAVVFTGIDILKTERPVHHFMKKISPLFIYLIAFSFFMVLFWPYLWENPIVNFIDAFSVMKRYSVFSYDVLYFGEFIKSTAVPWHYIPAWIIFTTPLVYIFFFLLGMAGIIQVIVKNRVGLYSNENEKQDFLFLLLFIIPLITVIVLNSALYDGWRHMYFLYAPFLLIAMIGFAKILYLVKEGHSVRERWASLFIIFIILFYIGSSCYQMIRNHPFQNVYFNVLAGSHAGQNFEMDYWGLSFRQGLEYIVKNDKRPVIKLSANVPPPLRNNTVLLDRHDISRLQMTSVPQADYFLTNYRWHPEPYPFDNEVYAIAVDKCKILSVFKLR